MNSTETTNSTKAPFVNLEIPLLYPRLQCKDGSAPYITRPMFNKAVDEFLHSSHPCASYYLSNEFTAIFDETKKPNGPFNKHALEFIGYGIDLRRIIGQVVDMDSKRVIVQVPNDDSILGILDGVTANTRLYYQPNQNDSLRLKKGTFPHIIEVALIRAVETNTDAPEKVSGEVVDGEFPVSE